MITPTPRLTRHVGYLLMPVLLTTFFVLNASTSHRGGCAGFADFMGNVMILEAGLFLTWLATLIELLAVKKQSGLLLLGCLFNSLWVVPILLIMFGKI